MIAWDSKVEVSLKQVGETSRMAVRRMRAPIPPLGPEVRGKWERNNCLRGCPGKKCS